MIMRTWSMAVKDAVHAVAALAAETASGMVVSNVAAMSANIPHPVPPRAVRPWSTVDAGQSIGNIAVITRTNG